MNKSLSSKKSLYPYPFGFLKSISYSSQYSAEGQGDPGIELEIEQLKGNY